MANGGLIIREKLDIANEKYAIETQISVHPKKKNEKSLFFC